MTNWELEVCVDTIEAATIAAAAGATRLELNSALSEDGLTPSLGVLHLVKETVEIPVFCMARPHNRGFVYSASDKRAILYDCESLANNGADGIVVGAISDALSTELDWNFLEQLARQLEGQSLVMHRAFDQVSDKPAVAKRLAELGFCRILTSGGPPNASDALDLLAELQANVGDLIDILPGGGVRAACAAKILTRTNVTQLHGSFKDASGLPSGDEIRTTRGILKSHSS